MRESINDRNQNSRETVSINVKYLQDKFEKSFDMAGLTEGLSQPPVTELEYLVFDDKLSEGSLRAIECALQEYLNAARPVQEYLELSGDFIDRVEALLEIVAKRLAPDRISDSVEELSRVVKEASIEALGEEANVVSIFGSHQEGIAEAVARHPSSGQ